MRSIVVKAYFNNYAQTVGGMASQEMQTAFVFNVTEAEAGYKQTHINETFIGYTACCTQ
jgi:hypothetical protein